MSLPSPKELLRTVAKSADEIVETLTAPAKQLASQLNLPTLPEPPKASTLVESLPEPPALPLPTIPTTVTTATQEARKHEEVGKLKELEIRPPEEVVKLKIV